MIADLTTIWNELISWLITAVETTTGLFYGTEGFTLVGTLGVVGLGISVAFLLIYTVKGFLRLR